MTYLREFFAWLLTTRTAWIVFAIVATVPIWIVAAMIWLLIL